jgi:hypothetical protein
MEQVRKKESSQFSQPAKVLTQGRLIAVSEGKFPSPKRKAEWFSNPIFGPKARATQKAPKAPKPKSFNLFLSGPAAPVEAFENPSTFLKSKIHGTK